MVCIYCGSETKVTNSRLQKRDNQVWRRRQCLGCDNTFTTHEIADLGGSVVVRYSVKDLAPFARDILFVSIFESCKHRKQAAADASALTQTIISHLRPHIAEGLLERDIIAAVAAATLERFDSSAATIYRAYHPVAS